MTELRHAANRILSYRLLGLALILSNTSLAMDAWERGDTFSSVIWWVSVGLAVIIVYTMHRYGTQLLNRGE